jgi:hypothetical protein
MAAVRTCFSYLYRVSQKSLNVYNKLRFPTCFETKPTSSVKARLHGGIFHGIYHGIFHGIYHGTLKNPPDISLTRTDFWSVCVCKRIWYMPWYLPWNIPPCKRAIWESTNYINSQGLHYRCDETTSINKPIQTQNRVSHQYVHFVVIGRILIFHQTGHIVKRRKVERT